MNDTRATAHTPQSSLAFNGERPEPLLEDYALGAGHRLYGPVLQRFHSADRLSPFDEGGANAYAYCLGDPVSQMDPGGNVSFLVSFRELLQRTTKFWSAKGGAVFSTRKTSVQASMVVKTRTDAVDGSVRVLPSGLTVIEPSTQMYQLTRSMPRAREPSSRLAGLFDRARLSKLPGPVPELPEMRTDRLWVSYQGFSPRMAPAYQTRPWPQLNGRPGSPTGVTSGRHQRMNQGPLRARTDEPEMQRIRSDQ